MMARVSLTSAVTELKKITCGRAFAGVTAPVFQLDLH